MRFLRLFPLLILLILCATWQAIASPFLKWDPNPATDQVEHYTLYRSEGGSQAFTVQPGGEAITGTSFDLAGVLAGLNPAVPYDFYVTASNIRGESGPSNTVTLPAVPGDPGGLGYTSQVNITFNIQWKGGNDAKEAQARQTKKESTASYQVGEISQASP